MTKRDSDPRRVPLGLDNEWVEEESPDCDLSFFSDDRERPQMIAGFLEQGRRGREKLLSFVDACLLDVHPRVVLRGQLVRRPSFVEPETFFDE